MIVLGRWLESRVDEDDALGTACRLNTCTKLDGSAAVGHLDDKIRRGDFEKICLERKIERACTRFLVGTARKTERTEPLRRHTFPIASHALAMKCRAPSPAVSENEADILDSLFTDEAEAVAVSTHENRQNGGAEPDFDFGGILNGARPNGGDGDEGDEAFIALQQAASFRKTSNLKGKAPKKGGGFQSMGMFCAI